MGQTYSKQWVGASSTVVTFLCVYSIIFRFTYKRLMKSTRFTPNECKIISSTAISMLNASLCIMGGIGSLFYDQYWKRINEESEPGVSFYAWSAFTGYSIIDSMVEIILHLAYKKNPQFTIPLDWGIIMHHILGLSPLAIQIPKPVYYWFVLSLWLLFEVSTIFLNFQKLGKYFSTSKRFRKYNKFLFLLSWFLVRLPIIIITWWRIIYYFKKFFDISFVRACIVFVTFLLFTLLNIAWTATIVKKIIAYVSNTEKQGYVHATTIQLGTSRN
eukprot:369272_1